MTMTIPMAFPLDSVNGRLETTCPSAAAFRPTPDIPKSNREKPEPPAIRNAAEQDTNPSRLRR